MPDEIIRWLMIFFHYSYNLYIKLQIALVKNEIFRTSSSLWNFNEISELYCYQRIYTRTFAVAIANRSVHERWLDYSRVIDQCNSTGVLNARKLKSRRREKRRRGRAVERERERRRRRSQSRDNNAIRVHIYNIYTPLHHLSARESFPNCARARWHSVCTCAAATKKRPEISGIQFTRLFPADSPELTTILGVSSRARLSLSLSLSCFFALSAF